jgi:hypothetical protein
MVRESYEATCRGLTWTRLMTFTAIISSYEPLSQPIIGRASACRAPSVSTLQGKRRKGL